MQHGFPFAAVKDESPTRAVATRFPVLLFRAASIWKPPRSSLVMTLESLLAHSVTLRSLSHCQDGFTSFYLRHLFLGIQQALVKKSQLFPSPVPIEFLTYAQTTGQGELRQTGRIGCEQVQAGGQICRRLLGVDCWNLNAGGFGNAHGGAAEIEGI